MFPMKVILVATFAVLSNWFTFASGASISDADVRLISDAREAAQVPHPERFIRSPSDFNTNERNFVHLQCAPVRMMMPAIQSLVEISNTLRESVKLLEPTPQRDLLTGLMTKACDNLCHVAVSSKELVSNPKLATLCGFKAINCLSSDIVEYLQKIPDDTDCPIDQMKLMATVLSENIPRIVKVVENIKYERELLQTFHLKISRCLDILRQVKTLLSDFSLEEKMSILDNDPELIDNRLSSNREEAAVIIFKILNLNINGNKNILAKDNIKRFCFENSELDRLKKIYYEHSKEIFRAFLIISAGDEFTKCQFAKLDIFFDANRNLFDRVNEIHFSKRQFARAKAAFIKEAQWISFLTAYQRSYCDAMIQKVDSFNILPTEFVLGNILAAGETRDELLSMDKFWKTARRYDYDVVKRKFSEPVQIYIKIEERPFSEGAMRRAFKASICGDKRKYVVKKYYNISNLVNNPGILYEFCRRDVQMQEAADYLTKLFASHVQKCLTDPAIAIENRAILQKCYTLSFSKAFLVRMADEKDIFCAETFLEGKYVKYNNNAGSVSPDDSFQNNYAQAFSHYTMHVSNSEFLVCDLQGNDRIFTDPQIVSKNSHLFGLGNMSEEGLEAFKTVHNCNEICKALNLCAFK